MPANPTMALCAERAVATSYMATRAPAAASHDRKMTRHHCLVMPNRSLDRRRDCRLKGWRLQISANRKRISLNDTETGEVLLEGAKITVESYVYGYFDGLEQTLGNRIPNPNMN